MIAADDVVLEARAGIETAPASTNNIAVKITAFFKFIMITPNGACACMGFFIYSVSALAGD